ncbi:MAG: zinc-binding alcohol dehydrogenase family protein [Bacteroidales bacterium]|nr:zinc-binding alcohol dehydrogenase family protein [Bacteroidales bacterium]
MEKYSNVIVFEPELDSNDGVQISIDQDKYGFSLVDIPMNHYETDLDDFSVLVRINAFSCNYRDKGYLKLFLNRCHDQKKHYYSFFGSEFSGEVIKVGRLVKSFKRGDRVMPDHCYPFKTDRIMGGIITNIASKRIQRFRESELIKIPDNMTDVEAAAFSLSAMTSNSMVKKANITSGDKVLVTSLFSNTAFGCLEILKELKDIELYALTTHPDGANQLKGHFNLKKVFNPSDFMDNSKMEGLLFNVILDPFVDIHIDYLSNYLNFNSRYITCGISNNKTTVNLQNACYNLIKSNSVLIGNCLGTRKDLEEVTQKYVDGRYVIHIDSVYTGDQLLPFISRTFNERHTGKVIYKY